MDFKDLLKAKGFDADAKGKIVLLRHRPFEPRLARAMPWMVSERPNLFEAYQSVPGRPEASLRRAELVASFLGLRPGTAHFVGLYRVGSNRPLDLQAFWSIPENQLLRDMGYQGLTPEHAAKVGTLLQFDLEPIPFYSEWQGKLVIEFSRRSAYGSAGSIEARLRCARSSRKAPLPRNRRNGRRSTSPSRSFQCCRLRGGHGLPSGVPST